MNYRIILNAVAIALACAAAGGGAAEATEPTAAYEPMHTAPAVWFEEYWDVKPEKFDQFVHAYRTGVYELARHLPGYRGYTFLTTIADGAGWPYTPSATRPMITPHAGVHLQGKIETDHAINLGNFYLHAHNVVIVHHFQTWSDYENFKTALAKRYSDQNGGADYTEYLVRTLYPFANNTWDAVFRVIKTGLIDEHRKGSDADGLDLEPHHIDERWCREMWDLPPENLSAFVEAQERDVYQYESHVPNFHGNTLVTRLPPSAEEAKRTKYTNQLLGGSDDLYVAHPGVMMDGTVRTDTSINFSALMKKTSNFMSQYAYPYPWNMPSNSGIDGAIEMAYQKIHPGGDWRALQRQTIFPRANNHWDENWRAVEDSFTPTPGP